MCGRYYVDDETIREIELRMGKSVSRLWREIRKGPKDVCPSQNALVLRGEEHHFRAEEMRWGFPGFDGQGLLINARAESALQKKTYRDSVLHRRCVIPAKGYYEWNPAKEKFAFESPAAPVLFLAGCFNWFENGNHEEERFVILTTEARGVAARVHNRMPLLLRENEIRAWLFDNEQTECILHRETEEDLECKTDYEQLSLF